MVFLVLGLAWFGALAGLLTRAVWGVPVALLVAILTLWYLPVGTALSMLYLAIVIWQRQKLVR